MQLRDQQGSWVGGRTSGNDGTSSHFETSDTNDGFFERPIRIATFEWEIGVAFKQDINPWTLFCEDPRIANRLAHFRNLKMDLHVQLLVNGNPFYYGMGIMFYTPLPDADEYSQLAASSQADLVEASQRPHIYFNPTKSEGGELVLPFVFPKSAMNIAEAEWRRMGVLTLRSMNNLQHVNESTDSLTVTVIAYASNVSVNTPTSRIPPDLKPQGADEYGAVSFPAHLVARAAGVLGDAPVIGKFARATEMFASAIGNIASLFGYSRPRAIPEQLVLSRQFAETAITNYPDTSLSLAVDAKKELTIDPRVVGLSPHDEMDFVSIASRESLIAQFVWSETQPATSHLFTQDLCPVSGLEDGGNYHVAPMGFIALPFEYWKGSIEVRLQVVASAYHRGRIRIVWDPDYVSGADNFNVNYSTMLDITESTEINLKIGWGQEFDYLRVPDLATQITSNPATQPRTNKNPYSNGVLTVLVVNPLTSPAGYTTNVQINMYARACEDFEVCGPSDLNVAPYVGVNINAGSAPAPPTGTGGPGGNPTTGSTGGYEPTPTPPPVPPLPPGGLISSKVVTVNPKQAIYNIASDPPIDVRGNTVSAFSGLHIPSSLDANGIMYMYSDVQKVFTSDMRLQRYGNDTSLVPVLITIGPPGSLPISVSLPANTAIKNFTVNIPLSPGWNTIPFSIRSDGSGTATLSSMTTSIPSDASYFLMQPPILVNNSSGTAKQFTNSNGVKVAVPVTGGGPINLTLPGYYPGTPLNVESMGETNIPTAIPPIGINIGAEQVTLHTMNPTTPNISIPGTGQFLLRGVSYLIKGNIVPQGQVEELNQQSDDLLRPEASEPDVMMGPSSDVRGLNDIYFGERITSIRQILKRFTTCYVVDMPDGATPANFSFVVIPHYPHITATPGVVYKYYGNIFTYFSSAFVCMRGGMRVKMHPNKIASGMGANFGGLLTRLSTERDYTLDVQAVSPENPGARPRLLRFSGSSIDTLNNKPYFEFELPYYANYRFTSGRSRTNNLRQFDIVKSSYLYEPLNVSINHLTQFSYAIAEDFSLSFFLSTPVLTKSTSI